MKTPGPNDTKLVEVDSADRDVAKRDPSEASIQAEEKPDIETGSICDVKPLYRGKPNCLCCITWSTEPLKELPEKSSDETSRYAILTRTTEGHGDFGTEQKLHSIVIQSPLIRDVLEPVLKEYPGITSELSSMTIEAPFACFYHRWAELKAAFKLCEGETAQHMGLLMTILTTEFEGTQKALGDLLRNNVIEHQYLWALFNPGAVLMTKLHGQDICMVLEDAVDYDDQNGDAGYALLCRYIDYSGSATGFISTKIKIPEFKGSKPLANLPAVPLRTREDQQEITERLVSQGRRFAELRTAAFLEYEGSAFLANKVHAPGDMEGSEEQRIQTQTQGRVMVDAYACFQFNRNERLYLRPLTVTDPINRVNHQAGNRSHRHAAPRLHPHPVPMQGGPHPHFPRPPLPPPPPPPGFPGNRIDLWDPQTGHLVQESKGRPKEADQIKLTEEQLLICAPYVRGYCFKTKQWLLLNIKHLTPIEWTEDMFKNLVLPTEEKQLLLALTRSHAKANLKFDDFVVGKGKGIIVMLDGPPGTGKTLTAEGVAEAMKAPLYTMSAGELGLETRGIEMKLSNILGMATMWNAILLIDEADIFMEQRGPRDLKRNELVSVFLRHLEYFKGVMILTTNRVEMMDQAFDSRVDIRLHYPTLDTAARRKVWQNFVDKLPSGSNIGPEELDRLAEAKLNGRQIKSAMKTAYLLASGSEENVRFEHVQSVLRITRETLV